MSKPKSVDHQLGQNLDGFPGQTRLNDLLNTLKDILDQKLIILTQKVQKLISMHLDQFQQPFKLTSQNTKKLSSNHPISNNLHLNKL